MPWAFSDGFVRGCPFCVVGVHAPSLSSRACRGISERRYLFVRVLVMRVDLQAAGSWPNRLALPLANAPRAAENCPPDSFLPRLRLPSTALRAGDGSLRASCGLLALWAAQPLACAPRGREKAPLGLFLNAASTPVHHNSKGTPDGVPLVPEAGVEPARCRHHGILSPVS